MSDRTIPYTHWAYFWRRDLAERCAAELAPLDFLCAVDHHPPPTAEEVAQLHAEHPALADLPEPPPHGEWLLRPKKPGYRRLWLSTTSKLPRR